MKRHAAVHPWCLLLAGLLLPAAAAAQRGFAPLGVGGVQVTPDGGSLEVLANQTGQTATFSVRNTRTVTTVYDLSCSASGNVTCTEVEPLTVSIGPNQQIDVTAYFDAGPAGSGTLTVTATGPASDMGYYNISVVAPQPPGVAFRNFNQDHRDRSLCLTSGAGERAAWQCGDLLVTHGMPGYQTLGKDRSLTLLYTSTQAAPRGLVPLAVTQGSLAPNAVYAELWINRGAGLVHSGASGNWGGWANGTRQIVLNYDASNDSTGVYPITVSVANVYDGGNQGTTISGNLIVINRKASRFGAGWSLAGVEQLYFNQPVGTTQGGILWVAGDGSAKLYSKLTATTWVAPAGAYRDTLVYSSAAQTYTRTLQHGIQVVFDAQGRHIQTVNRTGHVTQFFYSGTTTRVDSIKVPPAGRPRTTYKLVYDVAGKIDSIADPGGRGLNLTVAGGLLTAARDPEPSLVTGFAYDGAGRMLTRTSPRGFTTRYEYANGVRLTKVNEPYGTATPLDTATTAFQPWDERGLAGTGYQAAVDTGQVFTVIRGPRYPTVPDTARFYTDRWGAPVRIVNALGHTTTLVRGDAAKPALVTRVVYPNGRAVKLAWDARGNLISQTDSTDRGQATTSWEYLDPNTKDSPSRVSDALGRSTSFWYDSLGITDSIKDPQGHRTRFLKFGHTFGNQIKGLLASVTERQVNTWWESDSTDHVQDQVTSFTYDTLGNVRSVTSPLGVTTTYARDIHERVTDTYDPYGMRTEYVYDLVDRVTQVRRYTQPQTVPYGIQPLAGCDASQLVCPDYSVLYDPPLPASLPSSFRHAAAGVDSIADPRGVTRKFGYEARGSLWRETDEFGLSRYAFYGPGGQLDSTRSRDSIVVRFQYDVLGRRTQMSFPPRPSPWATQGDTVVVPGDTIRYTYDNMGNLLTARNRHGTIRREYYGDGLLKKQVAELYGFPKDSLVYSYNLAGQRLRVLHNNADTTDYAYRSNGTLDSLIVRWAGTGANRRRAFGFQWDSLGRRRLVRYPNGTTVTLSYDAGGTLRRVLSTNPSSSPAISDRLDFTWRNRRVDAAGRIWQQRMECNRNNWADTIGSPCGGGLASRADSNQYTPLGMLVRQQQNSYPVDTFRYDASGNLIAHSRWTVPSAWTTRTYFFLGGSNRLSYDSTHTQSTWGPRVDYTFSPEGAERLRKPRTTNQANAPLFRWTYHDGLGRMTGTRYGFWDQDAFQTHWNADSCRWDADGQLA
ncbi:MAG TPA: hypothetical protein VNJ71_11950, partial [Gemmatimonadales bacterium]|nr:hypothetical protein [Gemmatimonadales bacterium]